MIRCKRKPIIYTCENKGADQFCGNREAGQRRCFRYTDSSFIRNFKLLAIFCDCTGRFVSDLVGNPNCWFSDAQAHMFSSYVCQCPIVIYHRGFWSENFRLTAQFTDHSLLPFYYYAPVICIPDFSANFLNPLGPGIAVTQRG